MEFICTIRPLYAYPEFQNITIIAESCLEEEIPTEDDDGMPMGTELGKLEAIRYFEPGFHPAETSNFIWSVMDNESADSGTIAASMTRFGDRIKYSDECQESDFYEGAAGFIGINWLTVKPFARGHKIGLCLLEELRRQHAGLLMYCALNAEPYEIDSSSERDAMQKRLIRWYKRQPGMHFQQLAPRKTPEFLMSVWDGRKVEAGFGDIDNPELLFQKWKSSIPESNAEI